MLSSDFNLSLLFISISVGNYGHIMVTGSTDGTAFIVDARPTKEFNVFGYTSKSYMHQFILHC